MQNGNMYLFKGCKGKGIELSKTITYEELLKTVCQILRVDPKESNVSMNYVFNVNISTTPIQLRDDVDVKFFIRLNCTNGKLTISLCITIDKKNDNHEYELIINIDFNTQPVSNFNDENRISMSCDLFNCFDSHDLDTYKDVEDDEMNVNLSEDSQVMQIDLMEKPIGEYETHAEGSTKEPSLVGDDHIE